MNTTRHTHTGYRQQTTSTYQIQQSLVMTDTTDETGHIFPQFLAESWALVWNGYDYESDSDCDYHYELLKKHTARLYCCFSHESVQLSKHDTISFWK